MAKGAGLRRFSSKYGFFLSDASNEEIVSISKEITDEISSQVRSVSSTGLALLGMSLFALVMSILLISGSQNPVSLQSKSLIFLLRILSVALICAAASLAGAVVCRMVSASSVPAVFWRNVRETADDEKVYEQMEAVKALNNMVVVSKNNAKSATVLLILGGLCISAAFLYEMLAGAGYL